MAPDVNQLEDGSFIMYYSAVAEMKSTRPVSIALVLPPLPMSLAHMNHKNIHSFCPLGVRGMRAIDCSGFAYGNDRHAVMDQNSILEIQRVLLYSRSD